SHVDPCRVVGVPEGSQEILAGADPAHAAGVRRPDHPGPRVGGGTFHLHVVLNRCAFSAYQRSTTTARLRCWSTGASSLPRRRSGSRERSRTLVSLPMRLPIAWTRPPAGSPTSIMLCSTRSRF